MWLSVDAPLINGYYLDGNHDGGVYNSFNLAAYSFCRQNPVIYIDPDGNQFKRTDGGFWMISSFNKASYGSNWGWNILAFTQNVSANIGNTGISFLNTIGYYGQSIAKGQLGNIINNEVNGIRALGAFGAGLFNSFKQPLDKQWSSAKSLYSDPAYWEGITADATLMLLGGMVSGASKGAVVSTVESATLSTGRISGILRDAAKGKGNFGLGTGSFDEAMTAGKAWVGEGYKLSNGGKIMISEDGLRQFRLPSYKPKLEKTQANFEWRNSGQKQWQGNGHLDVN